MKVIVVLVLVVAAAVAQNDYVPQCSTTELGFLWPEYEDTSKYWQCTKLNLPPTRRTCAEGPWAFSYYHQQCVHPDHWIAPPTAPVGVVDKFAPKCTQADLLWMQPNYAYLDKYWHCTNVGAAPVPRTCGYPSFIFSYYHQQCVHVEHWIALPDPPAA